MAGKTAVVTGGLGGIGLEICRALLEHKVHNLCILDVNENETTVTNLAKEYPDRASLFIKCDVTNSDELDRAYGTAHQKYGSIDIVVNTTGVFYDTNVEKTLLINTGGVIKSSLTALNYMSTSKGGNGGVIINMASVCGLGPTHFLPIYTASKYAVVGFTRSMAHEFYENRDGVKFMLLCPGTTSTPLIDTSLERVLFPEFQSELIRRLAQISFQTPDVVAKSVIQALDADKNGSVWVSDAGVITEIELNERIEELKFKV